MSALSLRLVPYAVTSGILLAATLSSSNASPVTVGPRHIQTA